MCSVCVSCMFRCEFLFPSNWFPFVLPSSKGNPHKFMHTTNKTNEYMICMHV